MSKELESFENIMKVYGDTNSLKGTYNDFLTIKKALQRLDKYEEILKDRVTIKIKNPQYSNDYDILCAHSYHILNKLGKLEDIYDEEHKNE